MKNYNHLYVSNGVEKDETQNKEKQKKSDKQGLDKKIYILDLKHKIQRMTISKCMDLMCVYVSLP